MKRLLILLLLCALILTGCIPQRPEDHMLDGDGMEKPDPAELPVMELPAPLPADDEIEAIQPRLILDGSEPGEANGLTLRVLDYQPGALTGAYTNTCGDIRFYDESFTLSVKDGDRWNPLPWPEDKVWPDSEYGLAPGEQASLTLELSGLGSLDSGEYLLNTGGLETTFRLVYTE